MTEIRWSASAPVETMEGSTLPAVPAEPDPVVANGRYSVRRFLGQGASKQVFLATDTELGRDVAIAFICRAAASRGTLLRVRREVRAMARLGDHPNIVTVFDVGEDGGRTYIVSQFVAGGSLADRVGRLRAHRMPVPETISVARQVSAALVHAHRHAIVHRDLKPGNVLLTERGTALLGDFGMAVTDSDLRITSEHALIGTAPYMAPEQAQGHPVDVRSDLYSLGAMLFELLCGRPPFSGENASAIIAQHAHAPRPSAAAANPAVPAELDELVQRLMAVRPADRPRSTVEVRDQLEALTPGPRRIPAALPAVQQVRLPPALASHRQRSFVGRTANLAALRQTWRRTAAGQPSAMFVYGNAGIGKSRLCAQFAQDVHGDGATVLYGRCEEEALAPYGPFIQAIRHFAAHCSWLPDVLELPAGFELARLGWPVSSAEPQVRASVREADRAAERYELFDAAVTLVKAMAGPAPLLVIFEDLHWGDMPTLRLLRHLIRFVDDGEVMLICTMRDDEPKPNERRERALDELRRESVVETVVLEGLSQGETAALVEARAHCPVEPGVISLLCDRTSGNPFFIEEMLHSVRDLREQRDLRQLREDLAGSGLTRRSVPKAIEALVLPRLSALDDATREVQVLDAAAIIGREFALGVLAAVLGRPVPEVTDAVEEAIREGLVVEVTGYVDRFAFCHALVRETLCLRRTASERMRLHAWCGEALEARYATSGPHAAELAHHFFEAWHHDREKKALAEKAVHYAREAAKFASGALAYEAAVFHTGRALGILAEQEWERGPEHCDLLLARGRAQWQAGDVQARTTFVCAAKSADECNDPERLARAALGLGERYWEARIADEQYRHYVKLALSRLSTRDSALRARLMARHAENLHFGVEQAQGEALSREAVEMARRVALCSDVDDARVATLMGRHVALLHIDHLDERRKLIDEVLRHGGGRRELAAEAHHWRLFDLFELGDLKDVRREQEELDELARQLRQPLFDHVATGWHGVHALLVAREPEDLEHAERLAAESLDLGKRAHAHDANSVFAGKLFALRRQQGRIEELLADIERLAHGPGALLPWRAALALAYVETGDTQRGRERYERLAAHGFVAIPRDFFWSTTLALLTETCVALRDAPRARSLYTLLSPYATRNVQVSFAACWGSIQRYLGLLAMTASDLDAAEAHLDSAVRANRALDAPILVAQTQCDYGAALLRRDRPGDRGKASELGGEAVSVTRKLRLDPLTVRATALQR